MNLSVVRALDCDELTPSGFNMNALYPMVYSAAVIFRGHRPLILLNEEIDECLTWRADG